MDDDRRLVDSLVNKTPSDRFATQARRNSLFEGKLQRSTSWIQQDKITNSIIAAPHQMMRELSRLLESNTPDSKSIQGMAMVANKHSDTPAACS